MYARFDQAAPGAGLSTQDVNSFLSLYAMPLGTRYGEVPVEPLPPRWPAAPPGGPPELAIAPWVDARHGYEMRLPAGWFRIEEPHGVMAMNGPSWDYDASIRAFVWPADSVDAFLDRFGAELLADTWFRERKPMMVFGRPALEFVVEDPSGQYEQRLRLIELPGRRVMLLACEAPVAHARAWQAWSDVVLASLEVWSGRERLRDTGTD